MNSEKKNKYIERIRSILEMNMGDNLVALGVFGSIARKQDSEFSDVDLVVVTKVKSEDIFFILGSNLIPGEAIKFSLFFLTTSEAQQRVFDTSKILWPVMCPMLINSFSIFDSEMYLDGLKSEFSKFINESSQASWNKLSGKWLSVVYEFFCKIKKDNITNDQIFIYSKEMCFAIVAMLKSKNRKFFNNSYNLIDEAMEFEHEFPNLHELLDCLLTSRDIPKIFNYTDLIWDASLSFAKEHGIVVNSCRPNDLEHMFINGK